MTTFPQLVYLFKTLVNQITFNLAIFWLAGEFKGNLCRAVTLYITVTWRFPKGDRYIQVWLYIKWRILHGCENFVPSRRMFYILTYVRAVLATSDVQSTLEIPATDEIHMEDRNHGLAWA